MFKLWLWLLNNIRRNVKMVKVEIEDAEIQALDVILNQADVKPMVGFKLINLRYRIDVALQARAKQAEEKSKKESGVNEKK